MIEPWRTTGIDVPGSSGADLEGRVFPSGRQALVDGLRQSGLTRRQRVAVPEWSSACVLGAVSMVATPVPMREVEASGEPPAAVLVYDQWGWARCVGALEALKKRWPEAVIMYDTVDTADLDVALLEPASMSERLYHARIWSLSKVLGLSGGGAVQHGAELLPFTADPSHRGLCDMLEASSEARAAALDIVKSHVRYLPSKLTATIGRIDLRKAYAAERALRLRNLAAVRESGLAAGWPAWMDDAAARGGPGLCPVLRGRSVQDIEAFRGRVALELGVGLPPYHFDFDGDPIRPRYELCLAFPIHGEMAPAKIGEAFRLGQRLGCC